MVKIWDAPTRIYHWLQAFLLTSIALSGFGLIGNEIQHQTFGILLLSLIIWRIYWGVIGSDTSKFRYFFPSGKALKEYLLGREKVYVGHNPLGGLMVIFLIVVLLVQALTGLYLSSFIDGNAVLGRQAMDVLADIHVVNGLVLIFASLLHIVAILIYKLRGKPLVKAMFTGKGSIPPPFVEPVFASNRKALLTYFMSVCSVLIIIVLNL